MIITTFMTRATVSGGLIPLSDLIGLVPTEQIIRWRFRDISLYGCGRPFDMTFNDFETATRTIPGGFEVRDDQFRTFLEADFQIIDGEVEGWSDQLQANCVLRLDCQDASQWEITTELAELARKLIDAGFQPCGTTTPNGDTST